MHEWYLVGCRSERRSFLWQCRGGRNRPSNGAIVVVAVVIVVTVVGVSVVVVGGRQVGWAQVAVR